MSKDLNQCNFIGRMGQDPDVRYTPSGDAVANISLAVGWKTKDKEGTEWVRVVAFKRLAEIVGQYLSKGSQIYVSGSMRTRKWQDQSGNDRYTTEIVANEIQMLDSRGEGGGMGAGGGMNQNQGYQQQPKQQQAAHPHQSQTMSPTIDNFDGDSIPF